MSVRVAKAPTRYCLAFPDVELVHKREVARDGRFFDRSIEALTTLGLSVTPAITQAKDELQRIVEGAAWRDESAQRHERLDTKLAAIAEEFGGERHLQVLRTHLTAQIRGEVDKLQNRETSKATAAVEAAFRAAAPAVLGELRGMLAAVIAAEQKARKPDPARHERYEQIHAAANVLGWLWGDLRGYAAATWRRFAKPTAVFAWQYAEAQRRLEVRYRGERPRMKEFGRFPADDGGYYVFVAISGVDPTLADVAAHAEEWDPAIVTGRELLEHAAAIAGEIGFAAQERVLNAELKGHASLSTEAVI